MCRVEYERLVLAVDSSRHQLHMSGLDIISEGKPHMPFSVCYSPNMHICFEGDIVKELQTCQNLIQGVSSLTPSWNSSKVH